MTNAAPESATRELPRALAYVKPSRVDTWILLSEMGESTSLEVTRASEWSRSTIYRMLTDLEKVGAVEKRSTIRPEEGPTTVYEAIGPDGGARR